MLVNSIHNMCSKIILLKLLPILQVANELTHWGRVTLVANLTIIGSENGLSPGRHQAIIWTNAGILLIGPWGTNFSDILIGIHAFSFKKIYFKMASAKWRPFCLGLNVLPFIQTRQMDVWMDGQTMSRIESTRPLPDNIGTTEAKDKNQHK